MYISDGRGANSTETVQEIRQIDGTVVFNGVGGWKFFPLPRDNMAMSRDKLGEGYLVAQIRDTAKHLINVQL